MFHIWLTQMRHSYLKKNDGENLSTIIFLFLIEAITFYIKVLARYPFNLERKKIVFIPDETG